MKPIELWQGDCLELMKNIPDGSVDLVLTDPPYGTTACKWDSVIPFEPMWEQLKRIIKPNGVICLFGSEPFSSALRMSNIKSYRYDWIWKKNQPSNFLNANKQPLREYEVISVFYRKQPTYKNLNSIPYKWKRSKPHNNSIYGKVTKTEFTGTSNCNRNILDFSVVQGSMKKVHSSQKPVALLEYLIKTYTNEGEAVLDFTMGSGSTGVACVNTNRHFIGIELDEGYFNIAKKRIEEAYDTATGS